MAKIIEKTIGVNGDYQSVPAWIAAMMGAYPNFVTSDVIIKGTIIDNSAFTYTDAYHAYFSTVTCDASHYWWLEVSPVARAIYGNPGTGARILESSNTSGLIYVGSGQVVKISNLEINGNGADLGSLVAFHNTATKFTAVNCLFHNLARTGANALRGINCNNITNSSFIIELDNCSVFNLSAVNAAIIGIDGKYHMKFLNNLVYDISNNSAGSSAYGINYQPTFSDCYAHNNAVAGVSNSGGGAADDFLFVGGSGNQSHNASEDGSAPGTNSQVISSAGAIWDDPDNGKFFPVHSSVIHRTGTYKGATFPNVVEDMVGVDRDNSYPDIGPFQYTSKRVRILRALKSRLDKILKVGGYNFDLGGNSLKFKILDEVSPSEFPFITYITGGSSYYPLTSDRYTAGTGHNSVDGWMVGILAYFEATTDTSDQGNIFLQAEKIIEDIITALSVDHTLGLKFVHNIYISSVEPYIDVEDLSRGAIQIITEIKYDFETDRP